jgi:hypothetical protein
MLKTLIIKGLSETTFKKLEKWKADLGFADKDWSEFFDFLTRDVALTDLVPTKITQYTFEVLMPLWARNFAENLPSIRAGKAINDLEGFGKNKTAIVIGAGPSIWKHKHLELLAESSFDGIVMVCDSMLKHALKAGVTPEKFKDYFVGSVDGNRELIWKFYDDPIVDKYGCGIKGLFTTMVAPNTRERAEKAGIEIYWYNPRYDDWRRNESFTRLSGMMTATDARPKGIGCIRSAGQVGASLWAIAFSVLNTPRIGLIGVDTGYLDGTPIEETAYYKMIMQMAGDMRLATRYFRRIYNPYFKCYCLVDFVFDSYRKIWLELARHVPREYITANCTEGGSLFGEPYIYCMRFKDFLAHYRDENLLDYALKPS